MASEWLEQADGDTQTDRSEDDAGGEGSLESVRQDRRL
jgi:hypothetical protein